MKNSNQSFDIGIQSKSLLGNKNTFKCQNVLTKTWAVLKWRKKDVIKTKNCRISIHYVNFAYS